MYAFLMVSVTQFLQLSMKKVNRSVTLYCIIFMGPIQSQAIKLLYCIMNMIKERKLEPG